MAYSGIQPAEKFTSFATQEFSTSATTSYTLDHAVANENEIALFVNNVRQQPGSGKAYTATGTALTLSAATASTDTMYCIFLGRALQTVTPATNSITAAMVGNDLISGKDALSSEPADTDEFLVSDAGTLKRIDYSLIKGGGIEEYDQWRVTATIQFTGNGNTNITTNLERNDTAGFSKIGTGMTESSGVFTFPSTGIYEIFAFGQFYSGSNIGYVRIGINTTQDNGSNYVLQSAANTHVHTNYYNISTNNFVFDVTDTSTHKVKFDIRHGNDGNLEGNSSLNVSWFSFKKLGDT